MTERLEVEAAVLIWARKTIGMDVEQAAKRAGVSVARLQEFESGTLGPTLPQLRKLAETYSRPLAVFFLDEPPKDFDAMSDFRRLPATVLADWSPNLHKIFRRAVAQRDVTAELREEEGDDDTGWAFDDAQASGSPESAAASARHTLGITLAQQERWRNPNESLNGWVAATEALGILVLQSSEVSLNEMRGFSIVESSPAVIVLNGSDSPRGRLFTLAHEIGHLVLRSGGLCDLHETVTPMVEKDAEVFCNEFAASLLMPRKEFLQHPLLTSSIGPREWSDAELEQIGRRFGASKEATLRRLVTLGRATMTFYLGRRQVFVAAYEAQRAEERRRAKEDERGGFVPLDVMRVRDLGKPFVRMVLDAYDRRSITASTLSDYLGVKLRHVPKIAERVRG